MAAREPAITERGCCVRLGATPPRHTQPPRPRARPTDPTPTLATATPTRKRLQQHVIPQGTSRQSGHGIPHAAVHRGVPASAPGGSPQRSGPMQGMCLEPQGLGSTGMHPRRCIHTMQSNRARARGNRHGRRPRRRRRRRRRTGDREATDMVMAPHCSRRGGGIT